MTAFDEQIVRMGPESGAVVLFVPPLFEEANRMRRTLVLTMRALADAGVTSMLPDLPGQNESLVATEAVALNDWRDALGAIVAAEKRSVVIASLRGGCLIDGTANAAAWWRLAPAGGASLLRAMLRARVAGDREAGLATTSEALLAEAASAPILLTGNRLSSAMVMGLQSAEAGNVAPLRSVTLGADGIAGTPLWLRAEPGEDAAMAHAMADDIQGWMAKCGVI